MGLREAISEDPINFFKDKKVNQVITVKIISTNNQGLIVRPEGLQDMDFQIKKSEIAINALMLGRQDLQVVVMRESMSR